MLNHLKSKGQILLSAFSNFVFCLGLLFKASRASVIPLMLSHSVQFVAPLVRLFLGKQIIDTVVSVLQGGHATGNSDVMTPLTLLLCAFCGVSLLSGFCAAFGAKLATIHTKNLLTYLNVAVMRKSVEIDIAFFDIPQNFDEVSKSRENARSLQGMVYSTVQTSGNILQLLVSVVIAMKFSMLFTGLLFLALVPKLIIGTKIERRSYEFEKKQFRQNREVGYMYGLFFDRTAAKELRFYSVAEHILARYLRSKKGLAEERVAFIRRNNLSDILAQLPSALLHVAVSMYLVLRIVAGTSTIGSFSFITGLYRGLDVAVKGLFGSVSAFVGYNERIRDFKRYFMLRQSDVRSGDLVPSRVETIEFVGLSFAYPGSTTNVLDNVSLTIHRGEKVGLVGLNGAGKTTMLKLLTRFYEPTRGEIRVNGIDVARYDVSALRKFFAMVFQDFNIYALTIRENVAMADWALLADDVRIRMALNFSDFRNPVYTTDRNVDLFIGRDYQDDGMELSGGEKQKIAIARAALRDADVILLDEPASSLDPEAEHTILRRFQDMSTNKTQIMISHRLANMEIMDRIVVLHEGTIIESGTHAELMGKDGKYARWFKLQADKYGIRNTVG